MRNKKKALTKEEILFYAQRRKQYTQDFQKMSKQFDPKLKQLTRLLIARKQMMVSSNNEALPLSRKCNKVFASMTKSSEIQNKIDQGMVVESCKFNLEPMPTCSFAFSDICSRIQTTMVPIVEKIDQNIQQKLEAQQNNYFESETKKKQKGKQLYRAETFISDGQILDEYIDQLQIKSQRLHNIIASVSLQQRTKAYQDYNKRKSTNHLRPLYLQICSNDNSQQISDDDDDDTKSKQDYQRLIKFEKWKLKEQIEEDKQKRERLDHYVQTSLQKLGLQKKMFSMKELQEFLSKCQQSTNNVISEFKTERKDNKARKSQFLSSLLTTKNQTYSKTQSKYKSLFSQTANIDETRNCQTQYVGDKNKDQYNADLMRLGQLSLFKMNKVKKRFDNLPEQFKKATNRNLY